MMPPPSVWMKPWTADADPAMWPSGSIEIELKLDPIQPNWNIAAAKRTMKAASGSSPNIDQTSQIELTDRKPSTAECDSRRMPKRLTRREFRKEDTAISPATAANTTGNQTPSPYMPT